MIGVFLIGQKTGSKNNKTYFFNHVEMVKEIAELGTLEVKGVAQTTITNIQEDNSWFNFIKKTLIEKTVNLSLPYTAKYGIDMQSDKFNVVEKETEIEVTLPPAKLLSFEGHLDQKQGMIQKGYFIFPDENAFKEAEQKLYLENKKKLSENKEYIQKAQEKVVQVLQKYFKPFNKPVKVNFVE
ncbi:MAG: DUF4230 domain-containing protein [Bacteroidia bacterium]|nr:DUF4230 domain-containing protein [Bacteroidia bacterium]MDW8345565.1 DUF4230 domain-containing protein [Bacteroidia bacterium]